MTQRTALISVSDKTGVAAFARALQDEFGFRILSTGGTAALLRDEGLTVTEVSEVTGLAEMMDGRVKTLHPAIHGGILARRGHAEDEAAMEQHGISPIDLVAINLYPFEETITRVTNREECIEQIDIGGPAMVRAAAKNHQFVTIATNPDHYERIIAAMHAEEGGDTGMMLRQELSAAAFVHTAYYDALIAQWFIRDEGLTFQDTLTLPLKKGQALRYGENPHQVAAFYHIAGHNEPQGTLAGAIQLHGKELSYNNFNDTDAAWRLVCEFEEPAIVIVKHANPCGVATAPDLRSAYDKALACDPQSAYGGIIAANRVLGSGCAEAISKQFAEVVIAPGFEQDALTLLQQKKNLRLLHTDGALLSPSRLPQLRAVSGGYLAQGDDDSVLNEALTHVSDRAPTEQEIADMTLAFTIAKHVKSNAIVLASRGASIGIGAGQMSRVDSVRIACDKAAAAGLETAGAVLASDAFFPFDDNVHHAATAGITAIIQPGGSIRDETVIKAANGYDMALSFTGIRHFRH